MAQKGIIRNTVGLEDIEATDFASIFNALIGDVSGVIDYRNSLKASIINNNKVRLLDGIFSLRGFMVYVEETTYEDFSIDSGTLGMNRMDAIVATYQKNIIGEASDVLQFEVVKGTPVAGTPVLPTLVTGDINGSALKHQEAVFSVQLAGTSISKVTQVAQTIRSVESMTTDLAYLMSMDVGGTINSNTKQNLTKKYGKNSLTYEAVLDHVNEFFKRRNTMKTVNVPGAPTISFTNVLSWAELENMKLYEVQVVLRIGETFISYADAIVVRFNETIRLYKSVTGDAGKMQLQISASYNLQLEVSHPINSIATIYYRLLDNQ